MTAQGMEARRAETGTGSVHDSPIRRMRQAFLVLHLLRQYTAKRRLQRLVDTAAQSPATIEYRIRRAAAKAGWRKRKGIA